MYPQKVLQGIPDRKRAVELCVFYLLIVIKRQPEPIRQLLLCQPRSLARGLQICSHGNFPFRLAATRRICYTVSVIA